MESGLFILDAIVIVLAVIMSMRDDRAGPDQPSTSYFRYAEAAVIGTEPARLGRNRMQPKRQRRSSQATDAPAIGSKATDVRDVDALAATRRQARNGRTGRRPTRPITTV